MPNSRPKGWVLLCALSSPPFAKPSVFHSAEKLEWWVAQIVASGAPDFMCEHTGEEVHLYCLNARQIACFVRTGYDPKEGILPQDLHTRVPLDGKY